MLTINTNIAALQAQSAQQTNARSTATVMQQLSTSKRINSAVDDVAGLAISTRLMSQIKGANQAIRNANDGISLLQTAEGAIEGITNALQRMRELRVQSLNETNNSADKASIENEITSLQDEIGRIVNTTQFNGTNILDGTAGKVQPNGSVGYNFVTEANGGSTLAEIPNLSNFTLPPVAPTPVPSVTPTEAPTVTSPPTPAVIPAPTASAAPPAPNGILSGGTDNQGASIAITGSAPDGTNFFQNGRLYFQYAYSGSQPVIFQAYLVTGSDATLNWANWTSGENITAACSVTGDTTSSIITINAGWVSDQAIQINVPGFIPPWAGLYIDITGASSSGSSSPPLFESNNIHATGGTSDGIAAADFNEDGKIDLVTNDRNNSTISILLGQGNGSF